MNAKDVFINREERFSIGIDNDSGCHYISIPVANRFVDYEEYYIITPEEFDFYLKNPDAAIQAVSRCRAHEMDDRLIMKPGSDRGVPV